MTTIDDANVPEKTRAVYFRADQVGFVRFEEEYIEYGIDDAEIKQMVIEEFSYSGSRYRMRFFRQLDEVRGINVLKLSSNSDVVQSGDSYSLRVDEDGIHRAHFKADGITLRNEVIVRDQRMIDHALKLFEFVDEFWSDYYRPFFTGSRLNARHKKLPSLGVEILRFERI